MKNAIAIVGIHTGIGKTIVSAILAQALKMDYWKPVQAGDLDNTDSKKVKELLSNNESVVHPEAFRLTRPLSPHEAARLDGLKINYESMAWPVTTNPLLVETAGGVMSPMNDRSTMIDFVMHFKLPAILVVRHYLGSINHTMMSLDVLKSRNVTIAGMIICGAENHASQSFITSVSSVPILAAFPEIEVSAESIRDVANAYRSSLSNLMKYVNA